MTITDEGSYSVLMYRFISGDGSEDVVALKTNANFYDTLSGEDVLMLTPADARKLAAALLNEADQCL